MVLPKLSSVRSKRNIGTSLSEINVTPFIDVMLVLLVIFMVTTPLMQSGIGVNLHYIPVYLQPYYERLGFRRGHCPNAEDYYGRAISIPMYAQLGDAQQDAVVAALRQALA